MWIGPAFIHVCWCSSVTSSHLKEIMPYLMSSWHHHTILHPHLIVVAQGKDDLSWRWQLSQNHDRVRKFTICSMFVQFWSQSTCHSPIMNANHLIFVLRKLKKFDAPSHLHHYPITCKVCHKGFDPTLAPSHRSWLSSYGHCILPFIYVEANNCIEHVREKEDEIEDDRGSYGTSMHGSTLTTMNVLITLWKLIFVNNFLLYFHLYP
jgi:hypothetical protein